MQTIERDGFTKEQIIAALHAPNRRLDFRYELHDKNSNKKKNLTTVLSASVDHQSMATIKRTAKFTIKEDLDIDYLSDRIKPFVRLYMLNTWVEFSMGVFLLSSPKKKEENGIVIREIEAFDGLVILQEDKFIERYSIAAGTPYNQAIVTLLLSAGIKTYNIQSSTKTLPIDMEFELGTTKLDAINSLLDAINYEPLHVDVNGYFISQQYRSPSLKTPEYYYLTNSESVTYGGMTEELDLFNVPNKWIAYISNAQQEPLRAVYENNSPANPTSIPNRGRVIVDARAVDNIADQQSLNDYVERIAIEASQVYGYVEFETAVMPFHDYADVYEIDFDDIETKGLYSETSWSLPLEVGGRMKHSVRRVVSIA